MESTLTSSIICVLCFSISSGRIYSLVLILTFFEVIKKRSTNPRKVLDTLQAIGVVFVITVSGGNKLLTLISPRLALEYDQSWLSNSFLNSQNTGFTSYLLSAFSMNSILFICLCLLTSYILFFDFIAIFVLFFE